MNYLIIAIVVIVGILWAFGALVEWLGNTTKQVKTRMAVDKNKNIIERNQDIIQKCLDDIYAGDRSYYIDNEVKDCIAEIAKKEGLDDIAPRYREWLSQWQTRSDIPKEYLELKDHLKTIFSEKHSALVDKKNKEYERQKKEEEDKVSNDAEALFERNKELIDKFLEITERKVSIIDDYGDENWEVLPDEIQACIKKIAQKEGVQIDWQAHQKAKRRGYFSYSSETLPDEYYVLQERLEKTFRQYHEAHRGSSKASIDLNTLSGVEFETYVARQLKEHGYDDVRGTPATGDQGADLIAKKDGKTIIIQAKRYKGTVGNKAVQEVISAVGFYNGDEGWVVTSSTFTPSAKTLARKMNIRLVDGHDLERFGEKLDNLNT